MGCGTGVLSIQLALNEAARVDAIDVQREAVANTLANAVCNEVSDQVRGLLDQYWNLGQDSQVGTRRNADGHVGCAIGDEKHSGPQF